MMRPKRRTRRCTFGRAGDYCGLDPFCPAGNPAGGTAGRSALHAHSAGVASRVAQRMLPYRRLDHRWVHRFLRTHQRGRHNPPLCFPHEKRETRGHEYRPGQYAQDLQHHGHIEGLGFLGHTS